MRVLALALLLYAPAAVLADLYRWVDPQTGSVKFSSYPPPWYGDESQEPRSPKVQHIPAGRAAPANAPARGLEIEPAAPVGDAPPRPLGSLEARRKAMLLQISAQLAKGDADLQSDAFKRQLQDYTMLHEQLDRLDPDGATARREELVRLLRPVGTQK